MMDAHSRQLMELEEQEYQRQRQMVARQNQGQLQNTGMPQSRVGAIDSRSQQVSPCLLYTSTLPTTPYV